MQADVEHVSFKGGIVGYRRDQDPLAPAGPTWADLKKSLKGETKPAEGETKGPESETPAAGPAPPPALPTEYKAEAAAPIDRRRSNGVEGDGVWEPVKLKQIARGDVIRLPGLDAIFVATTPSLKGKDGYTVQIEPEPALVFGSALTGDQEKRAAAVGLQELLAKVGVVVSLGTIEAFSPEQVAATSTWVQAYAEHPEACKIARPLWLPIPDLKGDAS